MGRTERFHPQFLPDPASKSGVICVGFVYFLAKGKYFLIEMLGVLFYRKSYYFSYE